jgi:UDP-glucose 4-epimerase
MNILVTGGAGFVGTNLVKKLVELNNTVVVIDNYSAGKERNHISGATYIKGHTKDVKDLLSKNVFAPDIVYHLGEYSKIAPSFEEIDSVFSYNIEGSFAMLQYVKEKNIPIVYAASSTRLADEGESHSPYSFFKSTIAKLVKNYADWYGIKYSICYFFNVYGEYQDTWENEWQTVLGIFETQYKNNSPITVVGDGTQRRDFTYVGDIVSGLIKSSENFKNEEYQLGTGKDYSILEIAKMFSDNIQFIPARKGDRKRGIANVEDTKQKLGWKAEMTVENWISKIKNN